MARSIETPTFTSDIHERYYGLRNCSHKILIFRFNSASEVKRSDYPTERHPLTRRKVKLVRGHSQATNPDASPILTHKPPYRIVVRLCGTKQEASTILAWEYIVRCNLGKIFSILLRYPLAFAPSAGGRDSGGCDDKSKSMDENLWRRRTRKKDISLCANFIR